MAKECVKEIVPLDADVTIKIKPTKGGGRRLRIVCEYDSDLVESVMVAAKRIDQTDGVAIP